MPIRAPVLPVSARFDSNIILNGLLSCLFNSALSSSPSGIRPAGNPARAALSKI
jgi:hypothetical protein